MVASTDRSTFLVITTRASPTAATAMTEARTATWLMLEIVRNWGAVRVTSAPRMTMIATRLSSRCLASADRRPPVVRGASAVGVTGESAIEVTGCGSGGGRGGRRAVR